MKQEQSFSQHLGEIVLLLAVIAVCSVWRGYIVTKLWAWFVTAHFGIAPIGIPTAIGLAIIAGMFTVSTAPSKDKTDDKITGKRVVLALGLPAFALLFGWVVARISGQ